MAAKITVTANGPTKVEGEFTLLDATGKAWDLTGKPAIFLCRCGQSKKAPFCDGTHKTCNFVGPSQAP